MLAEVDKVEAKVLAVGDQLSRCLTYLKFVSTFSR